jgi:hypothetical protein
MPISLLSPSRLGIQALLYVGAAVLAGILLRARPPRADRPRRDSGDSYEFDDAGIPLRLTAMYSAMERTLR